MDTTTLGAALALVKAMPDGAAASAARAEAAAEQAEAAVASCVTYAEQTGKTTAQKAQARANIDAEGLSAILQEENTTGEYVTIPSEGSSVEMSNDEPVMTSNSAARTYFATCDEGDAFTVSGVRASTNTALISFIASDGTVLKKVSPSSAIPLTVFYAPEGSHWVQFVRWNTGAAKNNVLYLGAMIDVRLDALEAQQTVEETVSGATPVIEAEANHRYICSASAVTELSFTPSATGLCEIIFKSGTSATLISGLSSVKMPDWWEGCESGRTYDIMVLNGTYGAVMSWTT